MNFIYALVVSLYLSAPAFAQQVVAPPLSDAVWLKLLDQLPAILTSVGSIIGAIGAIWAVVVSKSGNRRIDAVAQEVTEVKKNTNGMTDKLVAAAHEKGEAAGMARALEGMETGTTRPVPLDRQ